MYLGHTDDALAHYVDTATAIEYPDHREPASSEALHATPPITMSDPSVMQYWDLSLEDCVSISMQNSKILRTLNSVNTNVQQPINALTRSPAGFSSVYDPAILESDPDFGVEAALSAFDAQFQSTFQYGTTDRPQNFGFFQPFVVQRQGNFLAEINKRSATGTQTYLRTTTDYLWSNNTAQSVPSAYTTTLEMGVRQPLLRGAGTQINRAPIVIARLQYDQTLATFENAVRDHVLAVETTYWNLYQNYRIFETAKTASESVLASWQVVNARYRAELEPDRTEAQAQSQYFNFRAQLEDAHRQLLNEEARLRLLMGIAPNDGRVIRPVDEPPQVYVSFDWDSARSEALIRLPELRSTKWAIQQRELELVVARNQLLPNLDATALYRWVGVGDELIRSESSGVRFPAPGSNAVEELLIGDFQEFGVGAEFNFPIGFRRELAGVRNSQLELAREKARLEDQEIAAVQSLSIAMRNLDTQYQVLQTLYNQVIAADRELESAKRYFAAELPPDQLGVRTTIDLVLDAERRRADALRSFYQTQAEYARAIAAVHFAKGSLLEYDNIALSEGPWPRKAYWDAWGQARKRAAAHYIDYGWTRPGVVSEGEMPQKLGTTTPLPDAGQQRPVSASPANGNGSPTEATPPGVEAPPGSGAGPSNGGSVLDRGVAPVRQFDPMAGHRLRRLPSTQGAAKPQAQLAVAPSLPSRFAAPSPTPDRASSSFAGSPNPGPSSGYSVQPVGWEQKSEPSRGPALGGSSSNMPSPAVNPSAVAAPPAERRRDTVGGSPSSRWSRYLENEPLPLRNGGLMLD
ncbi:MAG TPA: TolC family protein [Pirellulaceae bacterium]|nr:TolC family protein [Pirellulaceae bacterium]